MNKRYLLAVIAVAAIGGFLLLKNQNQRPDRLDAFAACLKEKGIIMYGAEWCSHCQSEKKAFGDSFRLVPYIECPLDPQKCLAAVISGYPTWVFPDGKKLVGEQGLETLSKESGCALPDEK